MEYSFYSFKNNSLKITKVSRDRLAAFYPEESIK